MDLYKLIVWRFLTLDAAIKTAQVWIGLDSCLLLPRVLVTRARTATLCDHVALSSDKGGNNT